MTGTQMTYAEAKMLALMTLVTFTNAGGLSEPTLSHLARFAPRTAPEKAEEIRTLQ